DGVLGFLPDHRAMSKGGSFSIFHQHLDVMLQLVKAFLLMLNLFFHFDELIEHQIGIFIFRKIFNAQWYMRWIQLLNRFGCGFTGIYRWRSIRFYTLPEITLCLNDVLNH